MHFPVIVIRLKKLSKNNFNNPFLAHSTWIIIFLFYLINIINFYQFKLNFVHIRNKKKFNCIIF